MTDSRAATEKVKGGEREMQRGKGLDGMGGHERGGRRERKEKKHKCHMLRQGQLVLPYFERLH